MKRLMIARSERLAHSLVEAHRPVESRPACSPHQAQVVHDVAAARDEHAFVAQRRKPPAGFVMELGGSRSVDAQLTTGIFASRYACFSTDQVP